HGSGDAIHLLRPQYDPLVGRSGPAGVLQGGRLPPLEPVGLAGPARAVRRRRARPSVVAESGVRGPLLASPRAGGLPAVFPAGRGPARIRPAANRLLVLAADGRGRGRG